MEFKRETCVINEFFWEYLFGYLNFNRGNYNLRRILLSCCMSFEFGRGNLIHLRHELKRFPTSFCGYRLIKLRDCWTLKLYFLQKY